MANTLDFGTYMRVTEFMCVCYGNSGCIPDLYIQSKAMQWNL